MVRWVVKVWVREVLENYPPHPRDFLRPKRCKGKPQRQIEGKDFQIPCDPHGRVFWWSTVVREPLHINPALGMYQEILTTRPISIDTVSVNPSLVMIREYGIKPRRILSLKERLKDVIIVTTTTNVGNLINVFLS